MSINVNHVIKNLSNDINNSLDSQNKLFIKRNNKTKQILFKDLVYFSCKNLMSSSYVNVSNNIKLDHINNVSPQAYHKRRNNCDLSIFDNLLDDLNKTINKSIPKGRRYYGVDGLCRRRKTQWLSPLREPDKFRLFIS